jgi:glycosyltransferase involved in cell wall biosynthesis
MSRISIITPAYIDSDEKMNWLNECVESVLSQDFADWDMIIVDDGSPNVVPEFDDTRIKLVRCPTRTYSPLCRNTGVALADSDCLLPLDADDRLFDNIVLDRMYESWEQNKDSIIYGNMVVLEPSGNEYITGKKVVFPEYKFEYTLDMRGIIPVTAMHSRECHDKTGGWKKIFNPGLEDIEYWIGAGKTGFCGLKINVDVFYYRKHGQSRTTDMRNAGQESTMRNEIMKLHGDVFAGRYPMGCCGGSNRQGSESTYSVKNVAPMGTDLSAYSDDEKVLITYIGRRSGSWGVVGRSTSIAYEIHGTGFEFPVHADDARFFKSLGRGKDFRVGGRLKTEVKSTESTEYKAPEPELGAIERLPQKKTEDFDLAKLGFSDKITQMLIVESWSIQNLAKADVSELIPYPGIGPKTAESIKQAAIEHG